MKKLLVFVILLFSFAGYSQYNITQDTVKFKKPGSTARGSIYRLVMGADGFSLNSDTIVTDIGPVTGFKYPEFALGIKYMRITPITALDFPYVSKIESGITSGGNKKYTIEISTSQKFTTGVIVCSKTWYVVGYKSVIEGVDVGPINNSGYECKVVVDWSKFVHEKTYTCNWKEGRIWAPTTRNGDATGGNGTTGPAMLPDKTGDFTADGLFPLYIFSGPTGKVCALDTIKNCKGNINIKNISAYDLTINTSVGTQYFENGGTSIILHAGNDIKIVPDSLRFIATGYNDSIPDNYWIRYGATLVPAIGNDNFAITSNQGTAGAFQATGSTENNVAVYGASIDINTGTGNTNTAFFADAEYAIHNYSFYGGAGMIYNADSVVFDNYLRFGSISAPTIKTNKLYNVSGTLYWTGNALALTSDLPIAGSFSGTGTATTTFTVTIGQTMANTTYKVNMTPTSLLGAAVFYINNKTTTTFDVVYLTGLTGTLTFDYILVM